MLKRILVTLALVAFIGMPAIAHPSWGVTTWETFYYAWQVKNASCGPVQVNMHVVRWADVYFANNDNQQINLVQTNSDTYEACLELLVYVNFSGLKIMAEYVIDVDIADKYEVSLVPTIPPGSPPWHNAVYNENATSLTITTIHLTGNMLPVTLCIRAIGVDPQAIPWGSHSGQTVQIGQVNITMVPTGAP